MACEVCGENCKKVVSIFALSQFLRPVAGMPPNLFSVYQGMFFGEQLIFCGRKYFWRVDRKGLAVAWHASSWDRRQTEH